MIFRVPCWHRGHDGHDPQTPPEHRVEGTRIYVSYPDREWWYDDWKMINHRFPELVEVLKGKSFVPGVELYFDHGQWNSRIYLDFSRPGEGIVFMMWARTVLPKLDEKRRFGQSDLPRPTEPFQGLTFKKNVFGPFPELKN